MPIESDICEFDFECGSGGFNGTPVGPEEVDQGDVAQKGFPEDGTTYVASLGTLW
jgi:hypothetical protein